MTELSRKAVIQKTVEFVKKTLVNAEGGHDWWHIERVWKLSKHIAETETADGFVVELGALLHDIADAKFHAGDEEVGPQMAKDFLQSQHVDPAVIDHVENIIRHISFKGSSHVQVFESPELGIVQDADRLDAMGAIGIARAFNFGGFTNRPLYDPQVQPNVNMSKEEYQTRQSPTINHFYEKLLLLKDRMNTQTGRELAEARQEFMEAYLDEFFREWDGKV